MPNKYSTHRLIISLPVLAWERGARGTHRGEQVPGFTDHVPKKICKRVNRPIARRPTLRGSQGPTTMPHTESTGLPEKSLTPLTPLIAEGQLRTDRRRGRRARRLPPPSRHLPITSPARPVKLRRPRGASQGSTGGPQLYRVSGGEAHSGQVYTGSQVEP